MVKFKSEFEECFLKHLRALGVSYDNIAHISGVSRSQCHRLLNKFSFDKYANINTNNGELKPRRFYVYVHKKKSTDDIFYVGKGTRERYKSRSGRTKRWSEIVAQAGFDFEIIKDNLTSKEAYELESMLINQYLENNTDLVNFRNRKHEVKELRKEVFEGKLIYDETSSTFLRWIRSSRGTGKGDEAGSLNKSSNYFSVSVDGKSYLSHRVIVCLFDISLSTDQVVDHVDGNKLNNNINNLRVVCQSKNLRNKENKPTNTGHRWISLIYKKKLKNWYYRVRWTDTSGRDQSKLVRTVEGGDKMSLEKALEIRDRVLQELQITGYEL